MYWSDERNDWYISEEIIPGLKPCKKLMINMPPQHGKSRTLFMFCTWVFGKNPAEKIITASYNDTTASDFSRYTRDGIMMQKNYDEHIVYSDVFPKTTIKKGHAGFEKWALDGQHFSYLGTGIGGSVTSKGATIQITDDPIKGALEARSEVILDKTWTWWTSTFASRVSAEDGEPIEIMNMTRWSTKDLCGRILADETEAREWFVLKMEAYDHETDTMLCPKLFGKSRYLSLKRKMDEDIFMANYHQTPMDITDKLFDPSLLKTFSHSDVHPDKFESSIAYIDVADQGDDRLAMVILRNIGTKIYLVDVVFRHNRNDDCEPICEGKIKEHRVSHCQVESNAMGARFGRELRRRCYDTMILQIHNETNKHTRILDHEGFINRNVHFLHADEWNKDYRDFMLELYSYDRVDGAKHDDAPDALTGGTHFIHRMYARLYA